MNRLLLISLLLPAWRLAATPQFESLSVVDGLSQSQVLAMTEDQDGFLWVGTQDGLNRYDGYHFTVYRHEEGRVSLSDNFIQALAVDAHNALWVGTRAGGLNRFDLNSGDIQVFRGDEHDASPGDNITALLVDAGQTLWVGTKGHGLFRYQHETGEFERFPVGPSPGGLSHANVTHLVQDQSGALWIATDAGLSRLDLLTRQFEHFTSADGLQSDKLFALALDSRGDLWLGSLGGGLDRLEPSTRTVRSYRHQPDQPNSLSSNRIWSLFVDSQGRVWVGTMDRGLNLYNPSTDDFTVFQADISDPKALGSNKIWSIFEDGAKILWFGTGDHGLVKLAPDLKPFHHVRVHPDPHAPSGDFVVTSLFAESDERLWIGTWGRGLLDYQPQTGEVTTYDPGAGEEDRKPALIVHITRDSEGIMWLGLWGRGLVSFDPVTNQTTSYTWPDLQEPPYAFHVTDIVEDGRRLWLATFGAGLLVFNKDTQQFQRFAPDPDDHSALSHDKILVLHKDRFGDLVIGTVGGGLNVLDVKTGLFRRYSNQPGNVESLSGNRITCLYESPNGNLWVGTDGGGLCRWDRQTDRFKRISAKDGLPSNVINGILPDGAGGLWLSTNHGLDHFKPEDGVHQVYGPAVGVQLEFNAGMFAASPNGAMFFGGQRGLNWFHPNEIRANPHVPPVVLTGFKVFNEDRRTPLPLTRTRAIELSHKQNFFSFEFAALDFVNPQKNQFAYMLEGIDKDWVHIGRRNYANYTNLPGGTYRFRVKGANADGVWNQEGAAVDITIVPPFWRKSWFQLLMFLSSLAAAGGLVYLISARKMAHLEHKRALAVELTQRQNEAREAERLHLARELHDGPIQDLHAIQLQMRMMNGSSLDQVDGYLKQVTTNLRTLCGELRPPGLGRFGLATAIRSHVETLQDKHPDLKIRPRLMNENGVLDADTRLALFRVCQEALKNAIHHADCREISITFEWDAENILLVVSDNGKGFANRDFFEWSRQGHFGLLGISERVHAIGGVLNIQTSPSKGTTLKVLVPVPGHA